MIDPRTVNTNKTSPIGTGPFKFKEWRRGDRVDLVRNPEYWQPGVPKLASVTMRFIGDPQAQAAALRAGDIDAFPNFAAPELFGEFQKDARFKAVVGVTPRKLVAALNNQRDPLKDAGVRQAMMSAFDRKAVIDGAFSGFVTPIGSHFAPTDPGYVDLTSVWAFDPTKARKLLAEAGYPNGFTVAIKTRQMSDTTRAAEVMQELLADVGITLNMVPSEFPAKWIDEVFLKKDYEVSIIDHAEPMDIDIYSRPTYYFGYHNPKFDWRRESHGRSITSRALQGGRSCSRVGGTRAGWGRPPAAIPPQFLRRNHRRTARNDAVSVHRATVEAAANFGRAAPGRPPNPGRRRFVADRPRHAPSASNRTNPWSITSASGLTWETDTGHRHNPA